MFVKIFIPLVIIPWSLDTLVIYVYRNRCQKLSENRSNIFEFGAQHIEYRTKYDKISIFINVFEDPYFFKFHSAGDPINFVIYNTLVTTWYYSKPMSNVVGKQNIIFEFGVESIDIRTKYEQNQIFRQFLKAHILLKFHSAGDHTLLLDTLVIHVYQNRCQKLSAY